VQQNGDANVGITVLNQVYEEDKLGQTVCKRSIAQRDTGFVQLMRWFS